MAYHLVFHDICYLSDNLSDAAYSIFAPLDLIYFWHLIISSFDSQSGQVNTWPSFLVIWATLAPLMPIVNWIAHWSVIDRLLCLHCLAPRLSVTIKTHTRNIIFFVNLNIFICSLIILHSNKLLLNECHSMKYDSYDICKFSNNV